MAENHPGSRLLNKELFVLLPIVGSAVAITFDVGYFWALDINLFTVFTVSEHIAFALEVLPIAIFATTLLISTPIIWDKARTSSINQIHIQRKTGAASKPFYKMKFFWFEVLTFIWLCSFAYVQRAVTSIAMLLLFVVFWIFTQFFTKYLLIPMVQVGSASFVCLLLSFTTGIDIGTGYGHNTIYSYMVKTADAEFRANVVRSGERGLLFFEGDSRQLLLLPWSEIKEVRTSRPRK